MHEQEQNILVREWKYRLFFSEYICVFIETSYLSDLSIKVRFGDRVLLTGWEYFDVFRFYVFWINITFIFFRKLNLLSFRSRFTFHYEYNMKQDIFCPYYANSGDFVHNFKVRKYKYRKKWKKKNANDFFFIFNNELDLEYYKKITSFPILILIKTHYSSC